MRRKLLKFNVPRRIIQVLSFLLFSAMLFDVGRLPLVLPVLWTWGLEKGIGDSFTALQLMLSGWRGTPITFPWLAIASFLIIGALLGKSLCGWVCPFGSVQDLVDVIKRKKMDVSPRTHKNAVYVKYVILSLALFISLTFSAMKLMGMGAGYEAALGIFAYAPFTALSPAETLFSVMPKMAFDFYNALSQAPSPEVVLKALAPPPLFWVQLFIVIGIIVLAAYVPRGWCRYFCPHGAIMAIMNKFSFIGLSRDPVKCVKGKCRACVEVCPMRVRILDLPWEKFSDLECIYCLECADACPNRAIRLKYP